MQTVSINIEKALNFFEKAEYDKIMQKASLSLKKLEDKTGLGNDFLGWLDLPYSDEYIDIIKSIEKIKSKVDTVVVVGIGGSYLGARAIISALGKQFEKPSLEVLYAGNNLDERYHSELFDYIENKDFGVVVISKSGTTTEPAIAFRILKNKLEKKYGELESRARIIAITDKKRGALKQLAIKEGYKTFDIADDIGGRFSVFSPVGLVPIALAGYDIEKIISGARDMDQKTKSKVPQQDNMVLKYASIRNLLYSNNKKIELLTTYSTKLFYVVEWWKQLFGESEGKQGKGLFPAGVTNTTDLHSLGQYIQEGERILFETVLSIKAEGEEVKIPYVEVDLDNLNYIAGKSMFYVNNKAKEGTLLAHVEGGVPNVELAMDNLDEYNLGALLFFFEKACAVSGYVLGVNPFDQPGVEAYKRKMFELLGKPK